jgi:formylglycine-generating enzyme required for sulfatase activity
MAGQGDPAKPISLFYSYSHRDEDLRRKLETHLAVLRRGGLIAEWHDRKIEPGDAWKGEIDRHLTSADIVLLLVSPDFFASDYCWGEEMTKALERHARGEARVIPVILRHCRWQHTPLANLQAVPRGAKPIKSWPDKDKAFDDVAAEIERAVQGVRQRAEEGRRPSDAAVQTPAPEIIPPVPPKSGATALTLASEEPSTVLRQTEIRAGDALPLSDSTVLSRPEIRQPGTVFRDVEAPWCPEMVVIPAGSFVMGSPEEEEWCSPFEGPQHEVKFAHSFALGCYPVTFEEYDHFCAEMGREKPPDENWGRGPRPVINVSWEDAQAYCTWLSEATGAPYRLPSEAEWEYACRAGTTTPFWTGATITTKQANYDGNYTYGAGRAGKYRRSSTPVDTFEANFWGLHDMHGNVWEWVEDCWNDSYQGAPQDGSAWLQRDCLERVVPGGSWIDHPWFLRSAGRYGGVPDNRVEYLGFRVSRTLTP